MAMQDACNTRWISILEHDLLETNYLQVAEASVLWGEEDQQLSPSLEKESWKGETDLNHDMPCLKTRVGREESGGGGVAAKACREKMRRDRLNDRFLELCAMLEPEKPPKSDKASILCDATRVLSQLRVETQHLKDANHQLQGIIKELKAEKNELRDEKFVLRLEKESLEKQLKAINVGPEYMSHPTSLPVGPATSTFLEHISHPTSMPARPATTFPPPTMSTPLSLKSANGFCEVPFSLAMSHWMPQITTEISNDHVLRPPMALKQAL